jgi:hypothetical protein
MIFNGRSCRTKRTFQGVSAFVPRTALSHSSVRCDMDEGASAAVIDGVCRNPMAWFLSRTASGLRTRCRPAVNARSTPLATALAKRMRGLAMTEDSVQDPK